MLNSYGLSIVARRKRNERGPKSITSEESELLGKSNIGLSGYVDVEKGRY